MGTQIRRVQAGMWRPDYKEVQAFHVTAGAKAGGKGNLTNLGGSPHIAWGGVVRYSLHLRE